MDNHLRSISKVISYLLRHDPAVVKDDEGWVTLDQLFFAVECSSKFRGIDVDTVKAIIKESEKKRFELDEQNGKIRAYYGHSVPSNIKRDASSPPAILFQGTSRTAANLIKLSGIKPMNRQEVHLSSDATTAYKVGLRHDKLPQILVIDAMQASNDGVAFKLGNEDVWLTDFVDSKYILNFR